MRFMAWHVEYFKAKPAAQGRSGIYEEGKDLDVGESLLVFISFEKADENRSEEVLKRGTEEIANVADNIGVGTVILNPYAHLFAELSNPGFAQRMLALFQQKLSERFEVHKLAFGLFYEIELKAKGHKLSRISRIV